MTEPEWLACEDPERMLAWAGRVSDRSFPSVNCVISDRKLRLFACACCRDPIVQTARSGGDMDAAEAAEAWADGGGEPDDLPLYHHSGAGWCLYRSAPEAARAWVGDSGGERAARMAALLRDIVGNPFRPLSVMPPGGHTVHPVIHSDLITPAVLSLAQAAYEERSGRECDNCVDGDLGCPKCEGVGYYYTPAYSLNRIKCKNCNEGLLAEKCGKCNGKGRIEDGALDPLRLAILADALEEAGCNVGRVLEHKDRATHYWFNEAFGKAWPHLTPARAAEHPLLAHLRGPGPHVRGCWALDLVLGKE